MSELAQQQEQGKLRLPTNKRNIVFILVCLCYFMVWFDENVFGTLTPYWSAEYSLTTDQIASISSAYLLGFFPMLFVAGVLCDKIGARATLMISIIFCGGLSVLMLFTHTESAMWMRNFIFGLFFGFNSPSCNKLLATWTNARERVFKVSLWNSFSSFSGIIGGPVSLFIATRLQWQYCFIIIGVMSVVLFIFSIFFLKNKPEDFKTISQEEVDYLNEKTPEEMAAETKEKISVKDILEPLKHFRTWMMGIAIAFCIGPTYVPAMWNSMYMLTERGMDPEFTGVLFSIFGFWPFIPLALIPLMLRVFKGNIRLLVTAASLISGGGFIIGALVDMPDIPACIMIAVLVYIVNPWGWGAFNAYWAATQKPHTLGMTNGLGYCTCTIVGWLLMNNSGKLIGDTFVAGAGNYTMLYLVSGIIALATLIPLALTHKVIVPYKKGQTQTIVDGKAL